MKIRKEWLCANCNHLRDYHSCGDGKCFRGIYGETCNCLSFVPRQKTKQDTHNIKNVFGNGMLGKVTSDSGSIWKVDIEQIERWKE